MNDAQSTDAQFDPLEQWATFPAAAEPRPLVLLEGPVRVGAGGFEDGVSKLAWIHGAIESDVTLPDGVLPLLVGDHAEPTDERPLRVLAVESVHADFRTDREPRSLPAYQLTVSGMRAPCIVLDPMVAAWPWSAIASRGVGSATVDPDGVTIHIKAFGGVLTEFHRADFIEHAACVVAVPITSQRPSNGRPIHAIGVSRWVSGRLAAPLGGRVLVDSNGGPCTVLPTPDSTL